MNVELRACKKNVPNEDIGNEGIIIYKALTLTFNIYNLTLNVLHYHSAVDADSLSCDVIGFW